MPKLVLISDTHGKHRQFDIPDGDILIHAGDIMTSGYDGSEVRDFNKWLGSLPHPYKIVIAGNHDWLFETHRSTRNLITNALYLEDSGIEMCGLQFWGSPVQPEFMNWAFNRRRGEDIQKHWDLIPENTDVLITHGPPAGFQDWTRQGNESLGCRNLRKTVEKIKPKLHVFGHIHGGYGADHDGTTYFVNASLLDEAYRPVNKPIVVELSE
jgi:Icc-related predicted phosphoesterase